MPPKRLELRAFVRGWGGRRGACLAMDMDRALRRAAELMAWFVADERARPVVANGEPEALRRRLGLGLGEEGCGEEALWGKLRAILEVTPRTGSRRFFNQLFGGRDVPATVGELLSVVVNTSMYTYKAAGVQILLEQEVIGRMCEKVGWSNGEGILTPGGSMSNMVAMIAARNHASSGVREEGLDGRVMTVYTSDISHYSVFKAANLIGTGRGNVRRVPTDGEGRMDARVLGEMIREDRARGCVPYVVNATAGTTVLGSFDSIPAVAEVCEGEGVWLHVDGAWGGSMLLCEKKRWLMEGVERADSVTWDAHKMMGVPLVCSAVLFREKGRMLEHFFEPADYLFQTDDDELNLGTKSIQCGRRNDALKVWTAWQYYGDKGYDARITKLVELAEYAAGVVERSAGMALSKRPQSVNVCFEVVGKSSAAICELLDKEGVLKVGYGNVDGRRVIRLVCVDPDMERSDIDVFFAEVMKAAARLPDGDNAIVQTVGLEDMARVK